MELDKIIEQAKALWTKQSRARQIALAAALLVVLGVSAALALYEPPVDYVTVASNLSEAEAAAIVEQLEADKVLYQLEHHEQMVRVKVPVERADKVRLTIASSGLESGGFGFSEYISAPYTVSAQREQKLHTIALSREISRIIGTLDAVRKAEVVITKPKKSLYRDEDDAPRASCVVYLRRGRTLSDDEVRGIVNLVSNSVDGLAPAGVTLVDGKGHQLWGGGEDALLTTIQDSTERDVQKKIEGLLAKAVGPDQFHVTVTATYERSERMEESEVYETTESSVISEHKTEERRGPGVVRMGVAGARGNQANPQADPGAAPRAGATPLVEGPTRMSETINRTPNVKRVQIKETNPRLVRLDVSVMINEPEPVFTRTSSVAGTSSVGAYLARGEVDLGPARKGPDVAALADLIRAAAGLDMTGRQDTLEIRTVPLWRAPVPAPVVPEPVLPPWYTTLPTWSYGAVAGCAALMLLAGLLSIRRRNRRIAEEEAELLAGPTRADELAAVLDGAEYEPEPTLTELRTKVHEQMADKEALAAEILSAWINDDNDEDDLEEAA